MKENCTLKEALCIIHVKLTFIHKQSSEFFKKQKIAAQPFFKLDKNLRYALFCWVYGCFMWDYGTGTGWSTATLSLKENRKR